MEPLTKRLVVHLKRLREQRGLTQEQLAKRAGVSHGYVARLELGMHDPSLSSLARLTKGLKVTVAELV